MRMEMMIETPQALRNIGALLEAADGSCSALHFGPYDYTASLGIIGASQGLSHPACDFARLTMQVASAGWDVCLSDGPTNVLPLGKDRAVIYDSWRLHYKNVRRALECAYYQGWDLHPAQLPVRYAAVYSFFWESMDAAGARLKNFIAQAAQATTIGAVFDDAATGQGLLNHFLRAVNSGAVREEDIPALTGLSLEELRMGSFARIMDSRTKA